MASQYLPRTISLSVSGGSGTVAIPRDYAGVCIGIAIKAPGAGSTYDFEILDAEDYGQMGDVECTGNITLRDKFQLHAGGTINITNAADGAYSVRLWYEE